MSCNNIRYDYYRNIDYMYICDRSEGIQHMSESVYRGLCLKIGTSHQVATRREMIDVEEMLTRLITNKNFMMLSGSRREGFRLEGSDFDIMIWPKKFRVIMERSQSVYYDTCKRFLLLSDSTESPPGFTLLQLMIRMIPTGTPTTDLYRDFPFFETMHGSCYMSSFVFKKQLREMSLSTPHILTEHGPCGNAYIYMEPNGIWPHVLFLIFGPPLPRLG